MVGMAGLISGFFEAVLMILVVEASKKYQSSRSEPIERRVTANLSFPSRDETLKFTSTSGPTANINPTIYGNTTTSDINPTIYGANPTSNINPTIYGANPTSNINPTIYGNTATSNINPVSYTHLTLPTNREV